MSLSLEHRRELQIFHLSFIPREEWCIFLRFVSLGFIPCDDEVEHASSSDRPEHFTDFTDALRDIFVVLHSTQEISSDALDYVNDLVNDIIERTATQAKTLPAEDGKLTSREVQTAVRLVLPSELAKHAVSEGTKAVTGGGIDLVIPSVQVRALLLSKDFASETTLGAGAPLYLAGSLESIFEHVLLPAGSKANEAGASVVEVAHISAAISEDGELSVLFLGA